MTMNPKQTATNQQPSKMSEQKKHPQQARTASASAANQPAKQHPSRDKGAH